MAGLAHRAVLAAFGSIILSTSLLAAAASAQNQYSPNVFFGLEYVLEPIAVKWACGGQSDEDLAALEALVSAFPEDAEEAELGEIVETIFEVSKRDTALSDIFDVTLTDEQTKKICAAARPLSIAWMKPEHMHPDGEAVAPPEEIEAFKAFLQTLEGLH